MFEVDPSIGLAGAAQRARADAAHEAYMAASHARIADHFEGLYKRWMAHADKLEKQVAELELALAVKEAVVVADDATAAAWRATHPDSPLRATVGKRRDGSPLARSTAIWIAAFDDAARKRGISNPEAHRIS